MDRDVGRILNLVDELGIAEKTIVFFCSDNGSARGWRGLFDSCGPLREKKGRVYEGGIRTPMVVRWPGKVPEGKTSKAVWYFADFLPTAAELASVRPPGNIDGISVAEAFYSAEPSKKLARKLRNRFLYWEAHGKRDFHQAVHHGDWKAVRLEQGKNLELYNLSKDVGEMNDVAEKYPEVVRKIEQFLKTCRTNSIHWPLDE
jgi:arylsulfatase A-like enzyme